MPLYCGTCSQCGEMHAANEICRKYPLYCTPCINPVVSPESCDPNDCSPCESNVRICSFVVKLKDDVRKYHNSLVYCEEDNTSYWVDNGGVPVITYRTPIYQDDFDPKTADVQMNTVYDFKNLKAYVFNPAGEYKMFNLSEVQ